MTGMDDHGRRGAPDSRGEDGFTLIELLLTMTLGTLVLFAILGASDVFRTTTEAASRLSVAQESQRRALRDITTSLRQARLPAGETSPIQHSVTTDRDDLVVATYVRDGAGVEHPGWSRICVSDDGRSLLTASRIADSFAAAGSPGACAPTANTDPAAGWTYGVAIRDELADAQSLFSFTSDACFGATGACPPPATAVRTIGIRLAVATRSTSNPTSSTVLISAVSLRNRLEPTP